MSGFWWEGLWSDGDREMATVLGFFSVVFGGPVVVAWLVWKLARR